MFDIFYSRSYVVFFVCFTCVILFWNNLITVPNGMLSMENCEKGGRERPKYLTCIYKETYNFFYTPPLSLHPSFFYCYCRRRRRRRFSEISNVQISFCVWKKNVYVYNIRFIFVWLFSSQVSFRLTSDVNCIRFGYVFVLLLRTWLCSSIVGHRSSVQCT